MLKTISNTVLAIFLIVSLSSCNLSQKERIGTQSLRDISALAKSTDLGVPPPHVMGVIAKLANDTADVIDTEKTIKETVTPQQIEEGYQYSKTTNRPNPAIGAIIENFEDGKKNVETDWATWGAVLSGVAIAAGLVGKFLGPPFNVGGMIIETVAKRCVPQYDNTKKAAVTAIASTDIMLTEFEAILAGNAQLRQDLTAGCGGTDPIKWIKHSLENAQNDLGGASSVSNLLSKMKDEMTTNKSSLNPTIDEFNTFVKKHV